MGETVEDLIKELLAAIVSPELVNIVATYTLAMELQAAGKWKSLPSGLRQWLQPHYKIDLSTVRYAENIETGHGQAITFENNIYFPVGVDLTKVNTVHWMMHELEHSVQYAVTGGFAPFVMKYLVQSAQQIISKGFVNIHDNIPLEEAAMTKADTLIQHYIHNRHKFLLDSESIRVKQIAVATNLNRWLHTVYVGTDNRIYQNWQVSPGGQWHGQTFLGGPEQKAKQITVARNQDGRLHAVYIGTDDGIYQNWQVSPGSQWHGQAFLDGPGQKAKQIAIARNQDGRLHAVYIGTDDRIYQNWQISPGGQWHGQTFLDGPEHKAKQIVVARNQYGRLHAIYIGTDNRIYQNDQVAPNKEWRGQRGLGPAGLKAKQIAVGHNDRNGSLEVFFSGPGDVLFHIQPTFQTPVPVSGFFSLKPSEAIISEPKFEERTQLVAKL